MSKRSTIVVVAAVIFAGVCWFCGRAAWDAIVAMHHRGGQASIAGSNEGEHDTAANRHRLNGELGLPVTAYNRPAARLSDGRAEDHVA